MSDALLFAALFATYGVLSTSYAGGPTPRDIFDLELVALNTAILLVSSITYGFAMLAMEKGRQGGAAVAGAHGAARHQLRGRRALRVRGADRRRRDAAALGLPVGLLHPGGDARPARHGRHHLDRHHAGAGRKRGLNIINKRRLMCLSMFWHFLDVIWIGVFTFVYLMGMLR
jgi:cytochrome o ubiquinol oxidase subunit 3